MKTGVTKDGFEERSGRAFAVRAGDVRARIGTLGPAEALRQNGDVFEVELRCSNLCRRGQFPAEREQIANRGFVIHFSSSIGLGSL